MSKGLIVMILLASISCSEFIGERGNGERITKTYTVDEFDEIELSGAYDIFLIPSTSNDITIEIDENLLQYIEIYVIGDRLVVGSDRRLNSREGIKIEIPVEGLKRIVTSGASDITSEEPIRSVDLVLKMSGAGKINLNLEVASFELELSGATLVYLQGSARKLVVDMSGAGSLEAENFEVEDCEISISGVGSVSVNVSGTLTAEVSGLGSVDYIGNPKSVKGDVSGIGVVSKSRN